jgi:sec-independent protein translocase protein TatC
MKRKRNDKKEMPFLEHLEELRWRIIKCLTSIILLSIAAFPLTTLFLTILTASNARLPHPAKLVFLKPTAMIMIRMEIAAGLIGSLPVVVYQVWRFVAPGLLTKEKRTVFPLILITFFCFALGALFAYWVIIPVMLPFLFSMGTRFIEPVININDYLSFVLRLIIALGLMFEMPVAAFFLARIGLITGRLLKRIWRTSVVVIFILSAALTPTVDPVNMTIFALPLLLLYAVSTAVASAAEKKRKGKNGTSELRLRRTAKKKKSLKSKKA